MACSPRPLTVTLFLRTADKLSSFNPRSVTPRRDEEICILAARPRSYRLPPSRPASAGLTRGGGSFFGSERWPSVAKLNLISTPVLRAEEKAQGRKPASAPENVVPAAETPSLANLVTLAVGVVVVAALYFGRDVFLPIVLAVLLAFVLAPLVDYLRKWRLGRVSSVAISVLLALSIIVTVGSVIGLQVAQLASDLPRYERTIREKVASAKSGTIDRLSGLFRHYSREIEKATQETPPSEGQTPAQREQGLKPTPVEVRQADPKPLELLLRFAAPVLHPLTMTGITFVVLIFILLQREDLRDRMIRLFGSRDLHRTTAAMDDAARRLSRFFVTQLALNAAFGVWVAAGLWLVGVSSRP
jgi:predicted PurR-regulated permease PerM